MPSDRGDRRRPGEGQRPAVLGRDGRQPVRRAAARLVPAGRRLRPAVRRRRRVVRRASALLDRADRPGPPTSSRSWRRRRRQPWRARSSARASAGCGTTSCCARWRSSLGLLNGLGNDAPCPRSCCSPRRSSTRSTTEFAILTMGGGHRRRGRRLDGLVGQQAARARARARRDVGRRCGDPAGHRVVVVLARRCSCCSRVEVLTAVLWNVITVSLRQTIIPDHLLGRVNSVYRFFGWGMIPIGAAVGGLVVAIVRDVRLAGGGAAGAVVRGRRSAACSCSPTPSPDSRRRKIDAARHAVEVRSRARRR